MYAEVYLKERSAAVFHQGVGEALSRQTFELRNNAPKMSGDRLLRNGVGTNIKHIYDGKAVS